MALADQLSSVKYFTGACPVKNIYNQLNAEDQKALDKAIEKNISANGLLSALKLEGYSIAWTSINLHLKLKCKCFQ